MRLSYGKQLVLTLLSLCCAGQVFAADAPTQQTGGVSNAIAFGVQAGQIAGSAQGCGLDIATFTARVGEAINKLALNPVDSQAAMSSYQQTMQQAQINQRNNNPIPCTQVKQDFNNLPLLRPDYQQSVIAQLNPGMTNNNPTTTTQTNTAPNQQPNLNNQAMPNTASNQAAPNNTMKAPSNPGNPAYPQQNYGPIKSFSNNFPGAVKAYGMSNMPDQTQQQPPQFQATPNNNYPAGNNNPQPQPPSFTNPNNNPPPVNNNYPSQ